MFNCEKCGACCRLVGCKELDEGNLCRVYEDRPDICRVDRMFELRHLTITREDYYKISKAACADLRRKVYGTETETNM